MSNVESRAYQSAAIESCRVELRRKCKRVLLVLPTGGGKTLTLAQIFVAALRKGKRCLFVAHRMELIDGAVRAFHRLGFKHLGVIRANDLRADPSAPLQIASIQTLARRKSSATYDLVAIDEAHRSMAKTYQRCLFEAFPQAIFIGLTATPCRSDGKPLGDAWSAMVIGATYSQLLEGGHIVAPQVYSTPVLPDLARVRTSGGDYDAEDLEDAVNRGALIGNAVAEWHKRAERRRTVVFAVSIAHSRALVSAFAESGVRAEHLDGKTPEEDRRGILARLESGETELVSNVGVLCEGWDQPSCKCLVITRPTKSLLLYMQMAGRILRPWQDVTPILIDHGGNLDRHQFPHEDREWSLDSKLRQRSEGPGRMCPACFAFIPPAANPCPLCQHEFPRPESLPPDPAEDLVPVDLALRTLSGDDARLAFFRRVSRLARDKGWWPKAVRHRYHEKFGEDPPDLWMYQLQQGCKKDGEWRAMLNARKAATA